MFAPDGYCLIETLEDRVRGVARDLKVGPDFGGISPDEPDYHINRQNVLAQFEGHLIREVKVHTLSALQNIESLSICSPNGLVLKISKAILTPYSEFSESRLMALAQDQHLQTVLLTAGWVVKKGPHFRNLTPTHMNEAFNQKRALAGEKDPNAVLHKFSEPFRSFIGWSLVFKEADLPSVSELQRLIGIDVQQERGGRPEKKSKALKAFDQIFPNGRLSTPWKVVAQAVGNAIEDDVSVITIQRTINERSKAHQKDE